MNNEYGRRTSAARGNGRTAYGNRGGYQKEGAAVTRHLELNDQNYVEEASGIMKELKDTGNNLTTSKIRNILAMVSDLYNEVRREHKEALAPEIMSQVQYIRLHIAYEAGRDKDVKTFVNKADLLGQIEKIGSSRKKLILFCHYMEALVAYHRYYGGRD